jgi:hypothetical protein
MYWPLQTPGGRAEFPRLVAGITAGDPARGPSRTARMLWAVRWKLGKLLGWDAPDTGLGARVSALRDRLPIELRDAATPDFTALPFKPLYLTHDEFAAEIANRTMHGVLHLGWVPDATGRYHGQLAVLVKPNRMLGRLYLAAIRPFRHLVVYPATIREIERRWRARAGEASRP